MRSFSDRVGLTPQPGELSVALARAGTGRTAFLVNLGLDAFLGGDAVLHAAADTSEAQVRRWYDYAMGFRLGEQEAEQRRAELHASVQVQTWSGNLSAERVDGWLAGERRALVSLDGFTWSGDLVERAAALGGLRSVARQRSAELWMTAPTHAEMSSLPVGHLPSPCDRFGSIIARGVGLWPRGPSMVMRKLRGFNDKDGASITVVEHPLGGPEFEAHMHPLPRDAFTLLSGGAEGAETAFGEEAERWGLREMTFSFPGRVPPRTRGLVELSEVELRQGFMSRAYVETQLGRRFPNTPDFNRLISTIWHQVATAGEVFIIGLLLPDGSVNGGTGWAAELGKHFNKPIHVFDQERGKWFRWAGHDWASAEPPRVRHARFTGTGTRYLNPDGHAAIRDLFTRSFRD